jgi:hypothetical protein
MQDSSNSRNETRVCCNIMTGINKRERESVCVLLILKKSRHVDQPLAYYAVHVFYDIVQGKA